MPNWGEKYQAIHGQKTKINPYGRLYHGFDQTFRAVPSVRKLSGSENQTCSGVFIQTVSIQYTIITCITMYGYSFFTIEGNLEMNLR